MIRKLVNWLLRTLHIRRKQKKSALVSIMELLPILYAMMAVAFMVRRAVGDLPLRIRIWLRVKYCVRYVRAAIIGY